MSIKLLNATELAELRAWAESDVDRLIECLRVQRLLDEVKHLRKLAEAVKRMRCNCGSIVELQDEPCEDCCEVRGLLGLPLAEGEPELWR